MRRAYAFTWTLAAVLLLSHGHVLAQVPLGTAFTYQGQLKQGGIPVNNTADFECSLWDAATTPPGNQIGTTQTVSGVQVADGSFTLALDFGASAFNGEEARWLQIAVRSPAGGGAYTTLSERQALTPAPFSLQTRGITVGADGNVGVGTITPAYPLDVDGIIRTTGGIRFPDGSQQYSAASSPSIGPRGVQEFAEVGDHTWVTPAGVHRVMLELWGGSGGGGGGGDDWEDPDPNHPTEYDGGQGGGGGAGGYVRLIINVTPGEAYAVRIGSAGVGGAGGGGDATDGEASEFLDSSLVVLASAGGGGGGLGGSDATSGGDGAGGAGGAGGAVSPIEGIARVGGAGEEGQGSGSSGWGIGGAPTLGTVTAPHTRLGRGANRVFIFAGLNGGVGGWNAGQDGCHGYAVIHW